MKVKKIITIFLIFSILIIIFESLHSMYLIKSINLFEEFIKENLITYNEYISLNLVNYFNSIILFVVFSLYNYLMYIYKKIEINRIYKGVWTILILGSILYKIFVYPYTDLFYYLSIGMQLILLLSILKYKESEE